MGGAALSLEGQVAVVTGGASGIGAAIAQGLEQDGATVEIFDLENGVDVTDEQSVGRARDEVLGRHGRLDVLVNNAGIYPHIPFEELTFAQWRHVLATNLDGVFLCHARADRHRARAGRGGRRVRRDRPRAGTPAPRNASGHRGLRAVPGSAPKAPPSGAADHPIRTGITGQTFNVDGGHRFN